jgi:hypothetical protein
MPAFFSFHCLCGWFADKGWTNISRINGNVKVWWQVDVPSDKAKAETILAAMEEDIWPALVERLMKRPPMSDAQVKANGGDSRLDIYLYPIPGRTNGQVKPHLKACEDTPVWMQIDSDALFNKNNLLATLTHEFMHTIQYSYDVAADCENYRWWVEASAEWIVDYVYHEGINNPEHESARGYLFSPELSLDTVNLQHEYGAYLFPFFLVRQPGLTADVIREIWFNDQTYDGIEAIDVTLIAHGLGGLSDQWPKFALLNWNRTPISDYVTWDALQEGAQPSRQQTIQLRKAPYQEIGFGADLRTLAASYYRFNFQGDQTRWIHFDNNSFREPGSEQSVRVQALVKIEGQPWRHENWTNKPHKIFCRDMSDERIEDLVIIISHSWMKNHVDGGSGGRLEISNVGCWEWSGRVKVTQQSTDSSHTYTTSAEATNVVFRRTRPPGVDEDDLHAEAETFQAIQGTINWSHDGSTPDSDGSSCTARGTGSYPVALEDSLQVYFHYDIN